MLDFELIDSILQGNQNDFERLIRLHQSSVFRIAIGFVHNKEDAEEITQDVFLKVYHSLSTFKKKSAFSTWLYRLTVNTCYNFLRRKRKRLFWTDVAAFFQIASKEPSVEAKMIERSQHDLIRRAIDALPLTQKLAFVLTKYENLSQAQVASIMKVTEGAVEQLVARAKNNLKKKLRPAVGFGKILLSKNETIKDER